MERQEFEALRALVERAVVVGLVLSVAVLVLLGVAVQQAAFQPEVLRVQRIEVVDATGRPRTVLGTFPGEVHGIRFLDATGHASGAIGIAADGMSALSFRDAAGRVRAGFWVAPDGSPELYLWDAVGRVLFRAP